ncbi:tetratricopeptide repeat protein [Gracilimonas tropica]|uniref:tetratricopeptide repeat protein n=1 Tax=Gracilimonas tropica TaxID=454600 RepID=UPI000381B875|nr:tetratricopeptide repeat protein [Gracilimonas tropica]
MKKLFRNLLAAFLFVGVLASCESTDPLIEEAQKNIFTQNYDSALAILDRSIQQNPNSGVPYYYKAMTYAEQARMIEPPANRKDNYKNFRESVETARDLFSQAEETPSEAESVTPLVLNTWGFEHNAAIEYVNNDSVRQQVENPLEVSISHLENAVIINPDSVLSWAILAQVAGMAENYETAISAQEEAMELMDKPESNDYLRLGIYQRNSGNVDGALSTLQNGVEMYPDSIALVQNLADVYMAAGQREKSIETIETLIERDPDNAQYRLALGTQLLQATTEISEQITSNYDMVYDLNSELRNNPGKRESINSSIDSLISLNQELTVEMDALSAKAQDELNRVVELRPEDPKAYEYLAISYQNKAAALYEERNFTEDNELASELDQQAKAELRKAMENYEKAVELDPDNSQYWQSLSRIYVQLDMQEKAEEAMKKAGM